MSYDVTPYAEVKTTNGTIVVRASEDWKAYLKIARLLLDSVEQDFQKYESKKEEKQ